MKITCPEDKKHNRFGTTAHVTEEWVVDEFGLFIDVIPGSSEIVHAPDKGDLFSCLDCGADAKAEDE